MNTVATTNTVTPSTENPKRPQRRQTAKEIIAANIKELIAQLEAGRSDALTAYLDAMSRFHNYIHLYHGNASLLAESLEVVQQTSAVILAALEPSRTETMADAELAKVA